MSIAGISPDRIRKSFSLEKNRKQVFKAGQAAGRSGSFFFFTYDRRFIVKTLQGSEKRVLLSILDDFIKYLEKNNN
jgi:1-phosphatidylinositol-4-phosphate 5-kinase